MSTLKTINVIHPSGTTTNIVNDNVGNVAIGAALSVAGSATFGTSITVTTSVISPLYVGGSGVGSTLTLKSTSGVGTSDAIQLKVGNNGATTAINVATTGIVSFPTTGAIVVPASTAANQPTGQTGMLRFNTTSGSFEGYNGSAWGSIGGAGGGATGGGGDQAFWENQTIINNSFTIGTGKTGDWNAGTFGPVTVAAAATITVPANSTWTVV
jgi:hypothetical protein